MEKFDKEIILSGISNINVADNCEDGACCDIVNMHNNNGVWSVCGMPEKVVESGNRVCKFMHCNNDFAHLISYDGRSVYWEANIDEEKSEFVRTRIADINDVISFEAMGNILISVCESGNQYSIFNKGGYSHIGKIEIPLLNFRLKHFVESSDIIYGLKLPSEMGDKAGNLENYSFIAEAFYNNTIMKMVNSANTSRTFNSPFLIRYAIRLFDGSYIKPSAPILMTPERNIKEHFRKNITIEKSNSGYTTSAILTDFRNYSLFFDANSLPSDKWDDIISSVDIFVSKPLFIATENFYNVKEHSIRDYDNGNSYRVDLEFPTLSDEEIKESLLNESLFYKVASYKLRELRDEKTFEEPITPPVSIEALPTQEILPIDNFSHYNFSGDVWFAYNSRFHIGNIRRYLPQPFNISTFIVPQNIFNGHSAEYEIKDVTECHIKVLVKSTTGDKYVEMDSSISTEGFLTPYISFPDSRATQMEIWIKHRDGRNRYISLPLKSSEVENMAYYINDDYKSIVFEEFRGEIPTENRYDYDYFPNLLRVSNSENPFYFPQELSYSVSNGKILNIAAVTTELSQGRYGDFPLYVFTSEGIWALQQGDGDVIYKSLLPVSRDIALSKKSIVNTDNAIIFLSEKGLMLLNGSNVAQISTFGLERYDNVKEREVTGKNFNITSSQNIVDDFKSYISSADIEFNYINNELLFLREGDNYMYAFSLNGGMWSRVAFTNNALNKFIKLYPQLLMADVKGNIYNLSKENETDTIPFIFSTRAIKILNNYTLKQIKEIIFKGELDYINDGDFTLEVEASNLPDREFRTISKTSIKNSFADGVRIPIYAPSYKYFRVSGYGNAKSGMNINNILFTYTLKYNSRVR